MRINDVKTFDSKPILFSQIDELLAMKNVTMQGNNINVPNGLLVITDNGTIPENTDIQRIFYVDDFPEISAAVKNSIYVNKTNKESKIFDGTDFASISFEINTNFANVSDNTLATTNAISAFVDEKISAINIPDTDLSNYYNKTESDEKFALKTDISEEVIYVNEFPSAGIKDAIYVSSNGETKLWNGTNFISMSYEALDEIEENENNSITIPTIQAVIDYVSSVTPILPENITTQGNTFNTGNQLVQLISGKIPENLYNSDPQHIFYVDNFPMSGGIENSIYINKNTNETQFYTGSDFIPITLKVINDLTQATNDTLATSQATVEYLSTYYANKTYVTDAITSAMLSGKVDLTSYAKIEWVNTELAKKANLTDIKDHLIKVDVLPELSTALANSIYIFENSSATFFDGTEFIPLIFETVTDFSNINNITIPTTQAVSTFINEKISAIDIPSTDLSNYYNKSESDEKFALKTEIPETSAFITKDVTNLSNYYNKSESDKKFALKTEIPETSAFITKDVTNLSNYYNKSESDEKFALKTEVNSKLTLSIVDDFPSAGINNTLYVNNNNHVQIYANDQWKNITINVVENFESPNQTTVPTTQAVKEYIDTLQIGPSMKTEATNNAIIFKKDISIYKIEVSEATTFTFDFDQLDENNCYTFELWVTMKNPISLTFPSDAAWLNDEVPDMSEASTYCIIIRKLPSIMNTSSITSPKALLNLAYKHALVLS